MALSDVTLLSIDGIEIPEYAARGITARIEPIAAATVQRRNLNGTLRNLSMPQFQDKYRVAISAVDQETPIFIGVDIGSVHVITLIPYMGTAARNTEDELEQLTLTMMLVKWTISSQEALVESNWQAEFESV